MSSFGYSQPLVFMCSDPADASSAAGWEGVTQPYEAPLHRSMVTSRLPPLNKTSATDYDNVQGTHKAAAGFTTPSASVRLSQRSADTARSSAVRDSGGGAAGAWMALRSTLRAPSQTEGGLEVTQRSRSPSPSGTESLVHGNPPSFPVPICDSLPSLQVNCCRARSHTVGKTVVSKACGHPRQRTYSQVDVGVHRSSLLSTLILALSR